MRGVGRVDKRPPRRARRPRDAVTRPPPGNDAGTSGLRPRPRPRDGGERPSPRPRSEGSTFARRAQPAASPFAATAQRRRHPRGGIMLHGPFGGARRPELLNPFLRFLGVLPLLPPGQRAVHPI